MTDIAVEMSRQALEALTGRSEAASISIPVIPTSQGG